MIKEPNGTLVMTTCKCRGNEKNLVMTRPFLEDLLRIKVAQEQNRIIELLNSSIVLEQMIDEYLLNKDYSRDELIQDLTDIIQGENK